MASDTLDILAGVIANPLPALPPREQRFGASVVRWWDGQPGDAVIQAQGGTIDDRVFAEMIVAMQLTPHGYKRAQFSIDPSPEFRKTAAWGDIMAKAKRLIQSGQVTLLRNGYNVVVAHVIGDHGEYNCEIGRDDPNSRAISTWTCECPWDQYAWQRTRKWKKYEGRPCAHVLAALWKSMSTPLDEQLTEEQAMNMGTGQKIGPGAGTPLRPHAPAPPGLPRSFSPDGDIIQGDQMSLPGAPPPGAGAPPGPSGPPPGPAQAPLAPPGAPGILPPFPGAQMPIEWGGPGTTPGGGQSPPGVAVSVPGAKPPSPFNPIQYPGGTYSKVAARPINNGDRVVALTDLIGLAQGPEGDNGYRPIPKGTSGEALGQDAMTGWVEVLFPLEDTSYRQPYHVRVYCDRNEVRPVPGSTPFIKRVTE